MSRTAASVVLLFSLFLSSAHAASHHDDVALDSAGLAQLEQRAEHAQAKEQAFLYTELVGFYTDLAGKEIAAGELDEASATIQHMQHCADRIHSGIARDTRKVKDAEMLLHTATFHLAQSAAYPLGGR